jgi:hypothetical protein
MAPSGKSQLAGRLGLAAPGPGGGRHGDRGPRSWGLRGWEGARCVQVKDAQAGGHAWAPASPPAGGVGAEPDPAHPCQRSAPAGRVPPRARALGLRGARQPLPPEPALPPETRRRP